MDRNRHWEQVYETKSPERVSWYEPHLETSLAWIEEAAPARSANIIDVGGGTSTLADDLYANGFRSLTVLDISARAIAQSQARLGATATDIHWIVGDVTLAELPGAAFDVWHDRAVFHFLTDAADRTAYRKQVARALRPSGQIIVATFSPNGPERCSGLAVERYDAQSLLQEFGPEYRIVKAASVPHRTPSGGIQEFLYCRMERAR
jgi:ubiquinone/menaquinone biosynthesis C-methylase UbiE